MFRTLLFDLDGTIIDSAPDVCESVNKTLKIMNRATIKTEDVKLLVGYGARTLCQKALDITGKPGTKKEVEYLHEGFLKNYRENPCKKTSIFPGAMEVLKKFQKENIKIGICTNKPEATCFPVLEALGLRNLFSSVICGDTLKFCKPDARHIYYALDEMNADLKTTAFIGDSEADIEAAKNAGIPCILVTFGYCLSPHESLGANALINHYSELEETLRNIITSQQN